MMGDLNYEGNFEEDITEPKDKINELKKKFADRESKKMDELKAKAVSLTAN